MKPAVSPLSLKSPLVAPAKKAPQWSVTVKNKQGESIALADPDVTRALVGLMDMEAVLGGASAHYGGPAGFAEMMSALHGFMLWRAEQMNLSWNEAFHFVNDAGHCENGIYALKANYEWGVSLKDLKKFRSLESPLTGHGEAEIFPEGVFISNGPLGSGLPQAQGLALADALSGNMQRVTVCALSDGACFEGEAKEAMAAIAGFANKGELAPFVCMISDNKIKLSGKVEESYSLEPTFEALKTLGWKLVEVPDGHNLQECYSVIETSVREALENPKVPIALRFHTIKGKGTEKTQSSKSGGHGFPLKKVSELPEFLKEIMSGKALPPEIGEWVEELTKSERSPEKAPKASALSSAPREKIQVGIGKALISAAAKGLPVVSISSDLPGSTGLSDFQSEFPERTVDVGVSESNMVSTAIGFSKAGYIPVVDTFAQFGTTKGALPMIMAQLSLGPVIAIYSHTGFQDAADGASHQSVTYLAMLQGIPHVDTYGLTSSEEAEALLTQALNEFHEQRMAGKVPRSKVFFLGRENFPKSFAQLSYKLGSPQVVFETEGFASSKLVIVAAGSLLEEGVRAAELLKEKGVGAKVINPSVLNSFPQEFYLKQIPDGASVITLEDHRLVGGFGAGLVQALKSYDLSFKYRGLGIGDSFGRSAYASHQLYKVKGLSAESVVEAASELNL